MMTTEDRDRRFRVQNAIASGRLEGYEPSDEALADVAEFADGTITGDELVERGRRRWGLD